MKESNKKIILTAGGTGGHLYGALSLTEELKINGYEVFLFTDKRVETLLRDFDLSRIRIIPSGTFTNARLIKWPVISFKILIGLIYSLFYTLRISPKLVIGFGGYPTIPTIFAAKLLNIKIIIHEQNKIIGRANKLMLNLCDRLTVGHLKVKGIKKKYNDKIFYTGNPIRPEIYKYKKDYKTHHQDGFLNLLIFGGSQGASFFSDIIPDSINKLDNKKKSLLRVFHQVRNNEFERVKKCYHSMNVKSEVKTFFYNLPELLNNSHLLISRSGASTVAEVAATKTPAIFIPFHHSIDDDQRLNTIELEKIGQVIVKNEKKLDSNQLYKVIDELIEKPEILEKMAKANKEIVANNSSEKIRSIIDDLLSNREL